MRRVGKAGIVAFTCVFLSVLGHGQTPGDPAPPPSDPTASSGETIVCIRHGEKPSGGLGQLTVRGLNRSLALPGVLLSKYGTPQFIFAPDPLQKVDGDKYFYVRPLATIEPTAIRCGLPVQTPFGCRQIQELETELEQPAYRNAVVFIAWEHALEDRFAKEMVKSHGGDPAQVPDWPGQDFDSIFVLKITRQNGQASIAFSVDHEGLDNLSDRFPSPAPKE